MTQLPLEIDDGHPLASALPLLDDLYRRKVYTLPAEINNPFGPCWGTFIDDGDRRASLAGFEAATLVTLQRSLNTRSLEPLEPMYISTVDSGNLAGHLMALAQGCRQLMGRPLFRPDSLAGIRDAVTLLGEVTEQPENLPRTQTVTLEQLHDSARKLSDLLEDTPATESEWTRRLEDLAIQAENLLDIARTLAGTAAGQPRPQIVAWAMRVRNCVGSAIRDLSATRPPERTDLEHRLSAMALQAEQMAQAMNFRFLYDVSRKLFSIGYRMADNALDASTYDLLASEARLASFMAIAKGDVSPRHWFLLGRAL